MNRFHYLRYLYSVPTYSTDTTTEEVRHRRWSNGKHRRGKKAERGRRSRAGQRLQAETTGGVGWLVCTFQCSSSPNLRDTRPATPPPTSLRESLMHKGRTSPHYSIGRRGRVTTVLRVLR